MCMYVCVCLCAPEEATGTERDRKTVRISQKSRYAWERISCLRYNRLALSLLTAETRDYKPNSPLKKNNAAPYYAKLDFQKKENKWICNKELWRETGNALSLFPFLFLLLFSVSLPAFLYMCFVCVCLSLCVPHCLCLLYHCSACLGTFVLRAIALWWKGQRKCEEDHLCLQNGGGQGFLGAVLSTKL